MSAIYVNNQWKEVEDIYVKVNGTWKLVSKAFVKRGQEWKEVPQIVRLAYASFSEDVPHPMPSIYQGEIGSFEILNEGANLWYISEGSLRSTGASAPSTILSIRDYQVRTTTTAGVVGVRCKAKATWGYVGNQAAADRSVYIQSGQTSQRITLDNGGATPRNFVNIHHPKRVFSIAEVEAGRFCLTKTNAFNAGAMRQGLHSRNESVIEVEDLEVFKLKSGVFNSEYGLATTHLEGERTQGEIFMHEANTLLYFRISTLGETGFAEVSFRRVDNENKTLIRIAADGSAQLIELENGNEEVLFSFPAGAYIDGTKAYLRADSANIYAPSALPYPNDHRTTSIASVGLAANEGRIERLDPGWVIADIEAWPYDVSQHLPFFEGTGGGANPEPIYPEIFSSYKSAEIDSPLYIE